MTDDRLLECPFCGAKAEWRYDEQTDDGIGVIECRKCLVRTPRTDYDDAVDRWNKRTPVRM